jgi:hypothetical protein
MQMGKAVIAKQIGQARPILLSVPAKPMSRDPSRCGLPCGCFVPDVGPGLAPARASLTPRLAQASASQSRPSQLNRPGLAGRIRGTQNR